jgi:hypothetical protein
MITITLKPEDWNAVLGCLAEAPFKLAAPLIQEIQRQASRQAQNQDSGGFELTRNHADHLNGSENLGNSAS